MWEHEKKTVYQTVLGVKMEVIKAEEYLPRWAH